jgi:magnesium transporter
MSRNPNRATKALVQGYLQRYPNEAARMLERLPVREIIRILEDEPLQRTVPLVEQLAPDIASQVLKQMSEDFARQILSAIDPMRAAALITRLEENDRIKLLSLLNSGLAKTLQSIMTYPQDSAGNLMDPRVMTFRSDMSVREVLSRLRLLGRRRVQDIFVVDPEWHLLGAVPLQDIAISPPTEQVGSLIQGRPVSVRALARREEVVELITQLRLTSLPVVDFEDRVIGLIRQNMLVAAVQEDISADIQTMVGVSKEERALSKASFSVRKRLPWLHINLLTAFLAAAVVGLFENTIAQFTALAVLLPVVAGQSGNTGAQALAVTMRGLALHEIQSYQWFRVFVKEFKVGLVNGFVIALVTSLAVFLWSQSLGLAIVIGSAMVLSMVAAGVSGVMIPIALTAFGQDPAQSSSIILTTVTDVVGFLSFLGIATLMAGMI